MKFLITTLAITFSVNSFAHGIGKFSPSQMVTFSPLFGTAFVTAFTADGLSSSTDVTSGKAAYKAVLADANEFRLTGNASAALSESINNIQSDMDVSDQEAVDLLESMAIEGLEN